MNNIIFYADDHGDLMYEPMKRRDYRKVYPTYPVDGLKVTRVQIRNPDAYIENNKIFGPVVFEAYPEAWLKAIHNACPDSSNVEDNAIIFEEPFDIRPLMDLFTDEIIQYQIDSDVVHPDYFHYFGADDSRNVLFSTQRMKIHGYILNLANIWVQIF